MKINYCLYLVPIKFFVIFRFRMKERSGGDVCTRVVENINAFYENVSTLNRAEDHERSLQEKILDIENRYAGV